MPATLTIDWVKLSFLVAGTIIGSGGLVEHRSQLQRESDPH